MSTPTGPTTSSQRAMDVVFASLVSQLQPELREALISSGLDDPGLLRAYPRTPVEDLRDDVDTTAVVAVPVYGIAGMVISPRRASRWILVTMCLC